MNTRIAITGIGAVMPLGGGAETLHPSAVEGICGIQNGYGRCLDFEPTDFLGRRETRRTDRFCHLALTAAIEAIEQANISQQTTYPSEAITTIIGTAIGGLQTIEHQIEIVRTHGANASSPLSVPMLMANAASALIAMRYGFQGEASALTAACASSAQAIVAGVRAIRANDADVAVVGGAEATLTDFAQSIFLTAGALSPTGTSLPFHAHRNGFVMSEGAGILVLERWNTAQARGAKILGEILGYGTTTDAFHITSPDPSITQPVRAIEAALHSANIKPPDIAYINAHGTGTLINDSIEARILNTTLKENTLQIPISSSKSYLGHLMGAAGAVELIATLLALRHKTVPATYGLDKIDPNIAPLNHAVEATKIVENTAIGISNSLGFGGHNVTITIKATE